jgi:hypothetical protein
LDGKGDEIIGDWSKLHNEELHNLYSSSDIMTWRLKTEIVEPEQTTFAKQRLGKIFPAATTAQVTIEELPFLCNSEVNIPV